MVGHTSHLSVLLIMLEARGVFSLHNNIADTTNKGKKKDGTTDVHNPLHEARTAGSGVSWVNIVRVGVVTNLDVFLGIDGIDSLGTSVGAS